MSSGNPIPSPKETINKMRAHWGNPRRNKGEMSSVVESLTKFWLFPSVSETDTTLTKENENKKSSVGEPLVKFRFLASERKKEKKEKELSG